MIDQKIVDKERKKKYKVRRVDRFMYRTRYFSSSETTTPQAWFLPEAGFHRASRRRDHRLPSEIMLRMSLREFHRAGREFVRQGFELFRDIVQPKRERKPHRIKGLEQIYSMKRLG